MVESGPAMKEEETDLLELIRILLQSWKLIVCITIISTGLAVTYALLSEEVFKAEQSKTPGDEKERDRSHKQEHPERHLRHRWELAIGP